MEGTMRIGLNESIAVVDAGDDAGVQHHLALTN